MRFWKTVLPLLLLVGWTSPAPAQWGNRGFNSRDFPAWELNPEMPADVFTFTRVIYGSAYGRGGRGWGRGGGWRTDYPDADLNFSYRLQELTSMKVHPEGRQLELTDPALFDHPFIYLVEPGSLYFSAEEASNLRRYLENGGFLMVDDFWGDDEWHNFYYEMKKVFPDQEPVELPLDHAVFNEPMPINAKPQIPNVGTGTESQWTGRTWERGPDTQTPHYRAYYDDEDRMVAIVCHNTDLGDGWEREGYNEYYFREFSEKSAYPLGINIIFYAMTH